MLERTLQLQSKQKLQPPISKLLLDRRDDAVKLFVKYAPAEGERLVLAVLNGIKISTSEVSLLSADIGCIQCCRTVYSLQPESAV